MGLNIRDIEVFRRFRGILENGYPPHNPLSRRELQIDDIDDEFLNPSSENFI